MRYFCLRVLCVGITVLGSAFAHGSDVITFRHPMAPVKQVVAALAKQTGMKLEVSPNLWDEVVLVGAKDVPVKDILDRIATATECDWVQEDGVARLQRTLAKVQARAKAEQSKRRDAVAKLLESLSPKLLPAYNTKAANDLFTKLYEADKESAEVEPTPGALVEDIGSLELPEKRLSIRLLQAIGAERLAKINTSGSVAFSDQPTDMQVRITGGGKALATYQREHAQFKTFIAQAGARLGFSPSQFGETVAPDSVAAAARVVMLVGVLGEGSEVYLSYTLYIAGPAGEVLHTESGSFEKPADDERAIAGGIASYTKSSPQIQLSSTTKSFFDAYRQMNKNKADSPRMLGSSAEAGAFAALHPDETDPLSLFLSDAVFSYADNMKVNVVAVLPDFAAVWVLAYVPNADDNKISCIDPKAFLRLFASVPSTSSDGWLAITPKSIGNAHDTRLNRDAFRALIEKGNLGGSAQIDAAAKFYATGHTVESPPIWTRLARLVSPAFANTTRSSPTSLRFFGALSEQQRATLWQGGNVVVRSLSPSAMSELRDELFLYREVEFGTAPSALGSDPSDDEVPLFLRDFEPTEYLPTGIPGNCFISLDAVETDILISATVAANGIVNVQRPTTIEDIATQEATAKMRGEPVGVRPLLYWPGKKLEVVLSIYLTPEQVGKCFLSGYWRTSDADGLTFGKLPEKYRKEIEDLIPKKQAELEKLRHEGDMPPETAIKK